MTRQLIFDLPAKQGMSRSEYFVSPANALAMASLEGWQVWPGGKMLLLGDHGTGKTHLATIWASENAAQLVAAQDLSTPNIPAIAAGPVVVEDAYRVAGQAEAEAALFHLHNLAAQNRQPLLLTATTPPRDWGLALPDLLSRMQAAPVSRIEAPDDMLLAAVLVKLFADRQLTVAPNLIAFLIARIPRSIGGARDVVDALDRAALAEGRPITRAFAAGLLDSGNAE